MTPAAGTAPPARWLLVVTVAIVALFTVLRFMMAASLDLRSDEAYYWTWSHQTVLSFLDQPPMVAWFERFGQLFFGDTTLGTRFAQLLNLPIIEILLADVARRRTGHWNAALFVVLAMEATLNYSLFAVVLEPNLPLLLFVSIIVWSLGRLDETMDPRWWLLIGAAGGLALLSKYIVLLLAPALLVFLLASPRHRRWLTSIWPWAAIAIALVLFSPVLVWNARHDWASFAFQGVRLSEGQPIGPNYLVRFVIYEMVYVGPVIVVAVLVGAVALAVRALRHGRAYEAALATAVLFPLGFLTVRSLTLQINQSWAYSSWPLGILALALVLPWGGVWRGAKLMVAAIVVTGVPLVGGMFYHAVFDQGVWFGRGDPFGQDAGFGEMADKVLVDARQSGAKWIATSDYRTYANLLWHIGKDIPVVQVNQRARFLGFAPVDPAQLQGTALYVRVGGAAPLLADANRSPLETIPVVWRDTQMAEMTIERLDGFTPELNPAPGSPAYDSTK